MHILKKMKKEGLYGLSGLDSGRKAKLEDTGIGFQEAPAKAVLFKKALELNPKNDNTYFELKRFYQDQGKCFQAENTFKKAIELNPKNDKAYVGLGYFYQDQGQFPQAEDAFKKALNLNPKNDKAYVELGRIYRNQDKFLQAENVFKKSIKLNLKNDKVYIELGWIYQDQGKYSQAEEVFKKAVELNPKNDNAYRAILRLYEEIGKPELAKEYVKKVNGLRLDYYSPVTVHNYRKLKGILDKKGIKLVCVQYPMRPVAPLKEIFEEDKDVIFVDNESVFREALKNGSRKEYFWDMFGGDFGHCTEKGNRLLAENIANVILREVFHRQ